MNKSCFMIKCITPDEDNIIDKLSEAINEKIQKQWPHAVLSLRSCMDYWKFKGTKKIIFNFSYHQIINVKTFIEKFPLNWKYSKGPAHDADTLKRFIAEDAIWSKTCHPKEIFLTSGVEWAHIYTWLDE